MLGTWKTLLLLRMAYHGRCWVRRIDGDRQFLWELVDTWPHRTWEWLAIYFHYGVKYIKIPGPSSLAAKCFHEKWWSIMINSPSFSVGLAPLGRCWYIFEYLNSNHCQVYPPIIVLVQQKRIVITIPPIIMDQWIMGPLVVTLQIRPCSTSMIMGDKIYPPGN